jgi:tRNA-dihydrouridine synthase C
MAVSAKMRLGVHDATRAVECALAIADAGADELVVHARTRADAYRPPAYWERVADIRAAVKIPVVANGEIWNVQDALRCREVSGCSMLMLGRGMVTDPGLARAIRAASTGAAQHGALPGVTWSSLLPLIADFWQLVRSRLERRQQAGRLKQWLNFLRHRHPQAELAYLALRTVNDPALIDQWLALEAAKT